MGVVVDLPLCRFLVKLQDLSDRTQEQIVGGGRFAPDSQFRKILVQHRSRDFTLAQPPGQFFDSHDH